MSDVCTELLLGDVTGANHSVVQLFVVGAQERRTGRSSREHDGPSLGSNVNESESAHESKEAPSEVSIDTAVIHDSSHREMRFGEDLSRTQCRVGGHRAVKFLV